MKWDLAKWLERLLGSSAKASKTNAFKDFSGFKKFEKLEKNIGVKSTRKKTNAKKPTTPKKRNWGEKELDNFMKIWNKLSKKDRNEAIDIMLKEANFGSGSVATSFKKIKSRLHTTLKNTITHNRKMSSSEKSFMDFFETLFIKEGQNKITDWHNLASSWLIEGKYSPKQKTMKIKMVRSRSIYTFYKVPIEYFLLIITAPNHAGTLWWRSNLWQFSNGKYGGR